MHDGQTVRGGFVWRKSEDRRKPPVIYLFFSQHQSNFEFYALDWFDWMEWVEFGAFGDMIWFGVYGYGMAFVWSYCTSLLRYTRHLSLVKNLKKPEHQISKIPIVK